METPQGHQFALGLSIRARPARHGDDYIPSGCIPDVIRGGVRNLSSGCYTFGEILDLAAHHIVWTGEAQAVEARLRAGVTVREFLRTRYGVVTGAGERGDRSDLKRFRSWLADARWRIRKLRADEKRRALWPRVKAWRAETPGRVM
jgi:hypothetical protein